MLLAGSHLAEQTYIYAALAAEDARLFGLGFHFSAPVDVAAAAINFGMDQLVTGCLSEFSSWCFKLFWFTSILY